MSNEHVTRFKKLYSDFVTHVANLHNYQKAFADRLGENNGREVRTSLATMEKICREMRLASRDARKQNIEDTKEERKILKERAKNKKRTLPVGREKGRKNGKLNNIN